MLKSHISIFIVFALSIAGCLSSDSGDTSSVQEDLYSFSADSIDGNDIPLSRYKGKVVLIVNTASKCGFTKQYEGLQELYTEYKDDGLVILGFPCNQFLFQEPGTAQEIKQFCTTNYGVTFPMFDKINVNGPNSHPLYDWLKQELPDSDGKQNIKWNLPNSL